MKIEVDIKKKYFLFLVTTILVLASIFGVYAVWSDSTTRVVSHDANDVKVTLTEGGSNKDYSLQELITAGRISVSLSPSQAPSNIYTGSVNLVAVDTSSTKDCIFKITI